MSRVRQGSLHLPGSEHRGFQGRTLRSQAATLIVYSQAAIHELMYLDLSPGIRSPFRIWHYLYPVFPKLDHVINPDRALVLEAEHLLRREPRTWFGID